jgi:N-acetyl-anhydromuramyl-L-alanine amidase AmpD
LHYTVETLEDTLTIFKDADSKVSSHLVISQDGTIFELVPCWDGISYRTSHSGNSRLIDENAKTWENFNNFSIGIELVNLNGNIFPYSDEQYEALESCLLHFRQLYPAINTPKRVVGHEHIAGWRGKVDPGAMFDWSRLYQSVYPNLDTPQREPVCPQKLRESLNEFLFGVPLDQTKASHFWRALSHFTETSVSLINSASARR